MMSQSPSLTAALEAVDRVFCAETGDLQELARIAGVSPDILFLRADLSGLDLRAQNVDFLLPLETNYHTATLTPKQLRAFRKAERQNPARLGKKILDLRVELVERFIAKHGQHNPEVGELPEARTIKTSLFKLFLLVPLLEQTENGQALTSEYMNGVLKYLSKIRPAILPVFVEDLFKLLGDIKCPVDTQTLALVEQNSHFKNFTSNKLETMIGKFRATQILDSYMITLFSSGPAQITDTAIRLSRFRKVHVGALEEVLQSTPKWEWVTILELLSDVSFDCDTDQAERLATHLTRSKWPSSRTQEILNTKAQPKVRNAIFRQILAQGQEDRVIEIVKWLDDHRGAAGALSLENAFIYIKNFDLAFKLARDLAPRLADNQISVMDTALSNLAFGKQETEQLASFRRQYIRRKSK